MSAWLCGATAAGGGFGAFAARRAARAAVVLLALGDQDFTDERGAGFGLLGGLGVAVGDGGQLAAAGAVGHAAAELGVFLERAQRGPERAFDLGAFVGEKSFG